MAQKFFIKSDCKVFIKSDIKVLIKSGTKVFLKYNINVFIKSGIKVNTNHEKLLYEDQTRSADKESHWLCESLQGPWKVW